jgi:hypothetical protein
MVSIKLIYFYSLAVSYNQPKFCPYAAWNPDATTFADQSTVGTYPYGIFVDTNNTVYVAAENLHRVQVWLEGSISPITPNFNDLRYPLSLFVTITGEIYVDNGNPNGRVEKSTLTAIQSITVMNVDGQCTSIFVDINDNLYYSTHYQHKVVKKSLNSPTNSSIIVAGNGFNGSLPNMLNRPHGIFVDINFDLYVADSDNHRIQLFKPGELNGKTLVGNGAPGTIILNAPTGTRLSIVFKCGRG